MNNLKKFNFTKSFIAICMTVILLVSVFTVSAVAAEKANITVSTTSVEQGKSVKVTVSINNNPGIWGLRFNVGYNHNILTLKSADAGTVFSQGEITAPPSLDQKEYIFMADRSDFTNTTANGELVTLTFDVKSDANIKEYPITLKLEDAITADATTVDVAAVNGSVSVVKPADDNKDDEGDKDPNKDPNKDPSENPNDDKPTNKPVEDGEQPNTSDNFIAVFLFVILLISAAACLTLFIVRKYRTSKK